MKKIFITSIILIILSSCSSTKSNSLNNMIAVMQVKDNIPGVCNNSKIIAIISLPGNGQVKAIAPLTDEEIEKKIKFGSDFP